MNLATYAGPAVAAVNPTREVVWQASTGNTIDAAMQQVPSYASPETLDGQIQPMQYKDLQQTDSLNLQGTRRKIYLYGVKDGVVRSLQKGGDVITDHDGATWLVAMVLEQWGEDWCAVAVTLQDDTP